jgi:hypothetical protein
VYNAIIHLSSRIFIEEVVSTLMSGGVGSRQAGRAKLWMLAEVDEADG